MKKLLIILAILTMSVMAIAQTEDAKDVDAHLFIVDTSTIDADDPGGAFQGLGVTLQLGGTIPDENEQTGGEYDTDINEYNPAFNTVPRRITFGTNVPMLLKVSYDATDEFDNSMTQLTLDMISTLDPNLVIVEDTINLSNDPQLLATITAGASEDDGGLTYTFGADEDNYPGRLPLPIHFTTNVLYTLDPIPVAN